MKLKRLCTVFVALLVLGANHLSARELAEGEWYLRLILTAEAEGLKDRGNSLGQLNDALPGYDANDLHELGQPFEGGTYLSVIFHRPDWEMVVEMEGQVWEMEWEDFNTDYRSISYIGPTTGCNPQPGMEVGDEWIFEVRSDNTARALSLSWENSESANMNRMVLVDLQENVTVPAVINDVTQKYEFSMNGAVRAFAWRLLSDQEYEEFVAAGGVNAAPGALEASASPAAFGAAGVTADKAGTSGSKTSGSGWLPKGWQGDGYDQPVPDGLPDDPFAPR